MVWNKSRCCQETHKVTLKTTLSNGGSDPALVVDLAKASQSSLKSWFALVPLEDVKAVALDHLKDCEELHSAGVCDHALTMKVLNTIMTAGGDAPEAEDLRFPL